MDLGVQRRWGRLKEKLWRTGGWEFFALLTILCVSVFCVGPAIIPRWFSAKISQSSLMTSLHSKSEADYSKDPLARVVPVIGLDILLDLLAEQPEELSALAWVETLVATPLGFTLTPTTTLPGGFPPEASRTPTHHQGATSTPGATSVATVTDMPQPSPTLEATTTPPRPERTPTPTSPGGPTPTSQPTKPGVTPTSPKATTPPPPSPTDPPPPSPTKPPPPSPTKPPPPSPTDPPPPSPTDPPPPSPTDPPPPSPTDPPPPSPTEPPSRPTPTVIIPPRRTQTPIPTSG